LHRVVQTALEAAMNVPRQEPEKARIRPGEVEHPMITGDDPYASLPWKQSAKRQNLCTIHVTPETLGNPVARELYDRLKEWKTMKVGNVSYRYSQMENGTEFLQQWRALTFG
jgi:hypothetical protein